MTADWADDNPSPHRALAIYNQKVPLARNAGGLANLSTSLAGGATVTLVNAAAIDQPSFHMLVGFANIPVGATIPFGRLKFRWADTFSGFTVIPDWAIFAANFGSISFAYVSGPSKGDELTVTLDNLDPSIALSYDVGISQTSQVYDRFRLQSDGTADPQIFTLPPTQPAMGIIGSMSPTLAINQTLDRLASAWGGEAIVNIDNQGSAADVLVRLMDPGIVAGVGALYGVAATGIIWSAKVSAGTIVNAKVSLPNGPVVIRETNLSSTSAITPTVTVTRVDT